MEQSEESDQEGVNLGTNLDAEKELCGSFNEEDLDYEDDLQEESESEPEDGELQSDSLGEESAEEEDTEVNRCVKERNIERLKKILKKREDACKKLQKEVLKKKQKEKQDKEMQVLLSKISAVNKTKKNLERSLASSRQPSPVNSPKPRKQKQKGKQKPDQRVAQSSKSREEKSEYTGILSSFLKLKQGSSEYADIVVNVMNATDNIMSLAKEDTGMDSVRIPKSSKKSEKPKSRSGHMQKDAKVDAIFNVIEQFAHNKGKHDRQENNRLASELLSALNGVTDQYKSPEKAGKIKGTNLIDKVKECVNAQTNNSLEESTLTMSAPPSEAAPEGNHKKLVSGKCTKPDESDIQVVVKYAHEKLDSRHVKERNFDKLEFNEVIADELELALLPSISEDERVTQIEIAKTLCYHRKYLGNEELKEGYDNILKQVEQGKITWKDDLPKKLHNYLDYRANVLVQNRVAQQESFTKVEYKKTDKHAMNEPSGKDHVIYCLEYNLGTCPHSDHHEGRFGSKKVTKFHICRRCHKDNEFKSHRETEDSCTKKKV